jgi:hypothetical protein
MLGVICAMSGGRPRVCASGSALAFVDQIDVREKARALDTKEDCANDEWRQRWWVLQISIRA